MFKAIDKNVFLEYLDISLLSTLEQKKRRAEYPVELLKDMDSLYRYLIKKIRSSNDQKILLKEVIENHFKKIELINNNKINFIDNCNK